MPQVSGSPFDSIESAHGFVALLAEVVSETKRDIDADIQREQSGKSSRRLDALRIACYSLEKLEAHMSSSCRILNDLRSLRRLLFEERSRPAAHAEPKPVSVVRAEAPASPVPASSLRQVMPPGARPGNTAAAA